MVAAKSFLSQGLVFMSHALSIRRSKKNPELALDVLTQSGSPQASSQYMTS